MRCPGCQHENPAGSNFCLGCGGRLALACAGCGADLPAGARFCNKCGAPVAAGSGGLARFASPETYTPKHLAEKILTSRSALEGERKHSLIEHDIAVLRAGNVVLHLPLAVALSAWVLAQLGEAGEALNRLREGEQLLEREAARGFIGNPGWNYQSLGRASLLLGRLDEARRLADRTLETSPRQSGFAAHALHLLGDVATHPDRFDAESGEVHYRQALALAEPRGMRPLVAHCHLGLGKLYRRTGKREQAREHLTTATTMYREMDMRFWLEKAEAETMELEA